MSLVGIDGGLALFTDGLLVDTMGVDCCCGPPAPGNCLDCDLNPATNPCPNSFQMNMDITLPVADCFGGGTHRYIGSGVLQKFFEVCQFQNAGNPCIWGVCFFMTEIINDVPFFNLQWQGTLRCGTSSCIFPLGTPAWVLQFSRTPCNTTCFAGLEFSRADAISGACPPTGVYNLPGLQFCACPEVLLGQVTVT